MVRLLTIAGLVVFAGLGREAAAITITGFTPARNNRFTGVFPTGMTPNSDPAFVGLGYDWSGVGWSTTMPTQGFGFITPQHYLVARHYGGAATIAVRRSEGTILTGTQAAVTATGYGFPIDGQPDLALGRLTAPLGTPAAVARYAVLDLNASSTTDSPAAYAGRPVLNYGSWPTGTDGPRVATGAIAAADPSFLGPVTGFSLTDTSQYVYEPGDSGSPMFIPWTNPDGGAELTIIGNNAAIAFGYNVQNFIGDAAILTRLGGLIAPDGYAIRIVGEPAATWQGGSGGPSERTALPRGANWSSGTLPTDQFTRFAGDETVWRTIDVAAPTFLRGLSFGSTGSTTLGFTVGGTATLTIGRGGITNYDTSRQVFTAPLSLGGHQYWDVGPGGVTAGAVATTGHLLEIAGSGTARITGAVSGTGGLAVSGHRLELSGASSYTGGTWVHAGTLLVDGGIGPSSGVSVAAGATLAGTGTTPTISGAGRVGPGRESPGILTAPSVDPAAGLDFDFEFRKTGSPSWASGTASGNDVLRLTSGASPFGGLALSAANVVNIYLDAGPLTVGSTFRGGFFTDRDADFLTSIEGASFAFYLASVSGTTTHDGVAYAAYTGPWTFTLSTVAELAALPGGTEPGFILQLVAVPEPTGWTLVGGAAAVGAVRCRRRCRAGIVPCGRGLLAGDGDGS